MKAFAISSMPKINASFLPASVIECVFGSEREIKYLNTQAQWAYCAPSFVCMSVLVLQ